jgi:hypothetical protein
LSYFIFSKNHYYLPKVAQLVKIGQSGHPGYQQKQVFSAKFSTKIWPVFCFFGLGITGSFKILM